MLATAGLGSPWFLAVQQQTDPEEYGRKTTDRLTSRRLEGWTDGWTERQTECWDINGARV